MSKIPSAFSTLLRHPYLHYSVMVLGGILLMAGMWATLAMPMFGDTSVLVVGQPSPLNLQAKHRAEFISDARTAAARAQAEADPKNLAFQVNRELPITQRNKLEGFILAVSNIHADPTLGEEEKRAKLLELSRATGIVSRTLVHIIPALSSSELDNVRRITLTLYDRAMSNALYELDEETLRQLRERNIPYWVQTFDLSPPQRELVQAFLSAFLRVNRIPDPEATQQRKREAREAIGPVRVVVQEGENIIRVGELVTPETIEKARATGALPRSFSVISAVGFLLLCGLLSFTFALFLFLFQGEVVGQYRAWFIIVVVILATITTARLVQPIWNEHTYAFPAATAILVLAVTFNGPIALGASVLLSIVIGLMDNEPLELMTTMVVGNAVAVAIVRRAERSLTFLLAGVGVATTTALSRVGFCLSEGVQLCLEDLPTILLFSGTNGGMSAILALGLFNVVGSAAGVVTPLKLMELSHPSQPLLRRLIQEAPGTYHHSIAVANLAEAAADEIGADALLLRVAAYYHDIGKTLRPFFFADNQIGRENVHNDIDPHTSAEIIIDHVREGIKIARAGGLPEQIIAFIATHHGTSVVGHFYQLALRQQDTVDIEDFRYPGPRPFTREQGVLMLADSVEATVRAKVQHGKLTQLPEHGNGPTVNGGGQAIEHLVNTIIDERVRSGQLDNTPLTLRDLIRIRAAFTRSLKSMYHPRIEYAPQVVKTSA